MIGTISIECNAKNPNMPLHPLRAYINSPSSLRITNVPRKIGKWNINKVTIVAIYPDSTSQTAQCVLTGGVWVGTIEGSTTAGTLTQGYSIIADGVDENGNDVTGYVLGKGDVEIMQSSSTPEPEPSTTFVRLQDDGTGAKDGDMYPTESGYMIQQNGEAHQLGTPFDQITAYVDTQVSSKAEISSVEAVADDVEDLSNSLSNYYTKSETSSVVEIQVALDGKQPVGDYALTSQIPTNVSQLSNDAGYLTEHQSLSDYYTKSQTSSNVEITTALNGKLDLSATADKALISQKLASDISDEHSTRVVVDEYDNVIVQKYTTGWYVSKIEVSIGTATDYTETNEYYAYLTDVRLDTEAGRLYFTTVAQDKQRNLSPYKMSSFTPDYSTGEFIVFSIWSATQAGGQAIYLRLTVTNAETPVWVNIARLVPDSTKWSGLLDTQITPNGQFVTPTQVKPYNGILGYANRALGSLFMYGRTGALTPDENHFVTIDYNVGKLCYVGQEQYPWELSMYNGTTFNPPIQMNYGYWGSITIKVNGRVRNYSINSNCWLGMIAVDSRNTRPCYIMGIEDETGWIVPDNNFYFYGTAYPITFSTNKLSIETIDGVEGGITCTRQSTGTHQTEFKYFAYEDELSAKADLSAIPTKTSDLSNDSGFITVNDVHGDYIEDSDGNKIFANREVHVINEISGLVFYDSIQLGYVDYLDENDIWQNTNHTVRISANAPESEYAWHILVSDFKYNEYITVNAEGDFNVGESINWSSGNYYYVRNCVFTRVDGLVKKTTLEHLATQEWVLAQLSALEARIAALEGN